MKKALSILMAVIIISTLVSCFNSSNETKASEGLEFKLIFNHLTLESSYGVVGIGTCTDKDIIIPSEYNNLPVTDICYEAFLDCIEITSVVIPDSVTQLGGSVFKGCTSLKSVVLPNSLTVIGGEAFYGCTSLTSITIPKSVIGFGFSVFNDCTSLTDVYYLGDIEDWLDIQFLDALRNPMRYGENWYFNGELLKEITIPDSVSSIGVGALLGFDDVTSVTIPISVKSIGEFAFAYCGSLENIYYEGTIEQWNAIDKSKNWDFLISGQYTIHCSDGNIEQTN